MKKKIADNMLSIIILFNLFTSVTAATIPMKIDSGKRFTLPEITIFATGGTIAGVGTSPAAQTNYTSGVLPIEALLKAVPEINNISIVKGVQFSNIPSENFNTNLALKLSQQINAVFENRSADGIVITHGTDTLEETALLLDLTQNRQQPIVIVGAMRPASAVSADGPYNLFQAVSLAASDSARNRGVMIAMNDRISSAFYTTKTNTHSLDTFKAVEQGYLGVFLNEKPIFYYEPTRVLNKPYFNIAGVTSLPEVVILYANQDMNVALLDAAVQQGAKGIVIAGEGAGSVDQKWVDRIQYFTYNASIPVVLSTRTGVSYISDHGVGIAAGNYNPQKAKLLLQLILNCCGSNPNRIKQFFGTDF